MMNLKDAIKYQEEQIQRKMEELKKRANYLASDMQDLAKRIENEKSVNTAGEVQMSGLHIDMLVAEIKAMKEMLQYLKFVE